MISAMIIPIIYYLVSIRMENAKDDAAMLNRLSFIAISIQRYENTPMKTIEMDIYEAFNSIYKTYLPFYTKDSSNTVAFHQDIDNLRMCWFKARNAVTDQLRRKKFIELCWLKANKAIFDFHYLLEEKRILLKNYVYMLSMFTLLLLFFLLYKLYIYVRHELEENQLIDLDTHLYNQKLFLQELSRYCHYSQRHKHPFTVLLIEIIPPARKSNLDTLAQIVAEEKRKDEPLYSVGKGKFALIAFQKRDQKEAKLIPLIERLSQKASHFHERFYFRTLFYEPTFNEKHFAKLCLEAFDEMEEAQYHPVKTA